MTSRLSLALLHSLGVSQRRLRDIPPESAEELLATIDTKKLTSYGLDIETAQKIVDRRSTLDVDHISGEIERLSIQIIHRDDAEFPMLLRELPDAPTILYVRGALPPDDRLMSVVGSRRHSHYSSQCLEKILPPLIAKGYGIVSGGAYGIDSVAHRIALKYGGYTACVFGAGIDVIYPPENRSLFAEIIRGGGALVSHFPLGTQAEPYNFPIRNVLVAGISRGTLVAEAGLDSGTLITARLALECNHDVFVIPADITRETAMGSNALIRDGLGKLVTTADDILGEYGEADSLMAKLSTTKPVFSDPLHEKVYEILVKDASDIDTIATQLALPLEVAMSTLAMMEIEGLVQTGNGVYSLM